MNTEHDFDGYGIQLYQDDDGDWLAHFQELPNISAFGDTPEQALNELRNAWEAVKASYKDRGEAIPAAPARREYSGQFNVRIDKRLHRRLAVEAARSGVSLNALVSAKLSDSAHHEKQ